MKKTKNEGVSGIISEVGNFKYMHPRCLSLSLSPSLSLSLCAKNRKNGSDGEARTLNDRSISLLMESFLKVSRFVCSSDIILYHLVFWRPQNRVYVVGLGYFSHLDTQYIGIEIWDRHSLLIDSPPPPPPPSFFFFFY